MYNTYTHTHIMITYQLNVFSSVLQFWVVWVRVKWAYVYIYSLFYMSYSWNIGFVCAEVEKKEESFYMHRQQQTDCFECMKL
jgi:hypothetical protein